MWLLLLRLLLLWEWAEWWSESEDSTIEAQADALDDDSSTAATWVFSEAGAVFSGRDFRWGERGIIVSECDKEDSEEGIRTDAAEELKSIKTTKENDQVDWMKTKRCSKIVENENIK
jgi:hypothetical protein